MIKREMIQVRDQSLFMPGRGPEDIFIDNEYFSKPLHFVIKVLKDPWSFSCNFWWPLCIKFDDKFQSNISYFLITSDGKRTGILSTEKSGS